MMNVCEEGSDGVGGGVGVQWRLRSIRRKPIRPIFFRHVYPLGSHKDSIQVCVCKLPPYYGRALLLLH